MLGHVPGAQRLVEEWSDEDEASFVTNKNFSKTKLELAPGDLCRKCTAAVNMRRGDLGDTGTGETWSGACGNMGCPRYTASRPQGMSYIISVKKTLDYCLDPFDI